MRLAILSILAAFAIAACQTPKETTDATSTADSTAAPALPVTLKMKWETDTTLTTCESVIYDKDQDILFVSNINGAPDGKDGNGTIAKVSLDGKVVDVAWAKGMDAPKGLGLANGKLYVTDIDRIHEIDSKTGKITKTHKVDGAKFLNDITTDANGKVFISDMAAGTIHVIENGKLSKWMENVAGPNGLYVDGGQLMMVTWDSKTFNSIDIASKQVTVKADSIENGDGVEAIGDGAFLVSSWNGMVHHIAADGTKTLVLDTRNEQVNAADIEYIQERQLLLVPGFFKNKVIAYDLSK